jgi:hypothetical protein
MGPKAVAALGGRLCGQVGAYSSTSTHPGLADLSSGNPDPPAARIPEGLSVAMSASIARGYQGIRDRSGDDNPHWKGEGVPVLVGRRDHVLVKRHRPRSGTRRGSPFVRALRKLVSVVETGPAGGTLSSTTGPGLERAGRIRPEQWVGPGTSVGLLASRGRAARTGHPACKRVRRTPPSMLCPGGQCSATGIIGCFDGPAVGWWSGGLVIYGSPGDSLNGKGLADRL